MNEAQLILDITAIGISVYTLIVFPKKLFEFDKWTSGQIDYIRSRLQELQDDLKQTIKFQEEMNQHSGGIESGVYLPKESQSKDDPVEYVKAIDKNLDEAWKDIINAKA